MLSETNLFHRRNKSIPSPEEPEVENAEVRKCRFGKGDVRLPVMQVENADLRKGDVRLSVIFEKPYANFEIETKNHL